MNQWTKILKIIPGDVKKPLKKDFYTAIQYRKGVDSATQCLKKINRLADNIMRHELTKEKLVSFLLQNGIDDIDTKKEVKLRGATHPEEIHSIISKMENIKREIQMENTVAAIRTQKKTYVRAAQHQGGYQSKPMRFEERKPVHRANDVQINRHQYPQHQIQSRIPYRGYERNGNYHQQRPRRCYACREEGHIRFQCPNVKCPQCDKPGHFRHQCHERSEYRSSYFRNQHSRFNVGAIGDRDDYSVTDDQDVPEIQHPKSNALQREEVIGAIH